MREYDPDAKTAPEDQNEPENLEEYGSPVPGNSITDSFNPYEAALETGPDGLPVEQTPPWHSQDTAPIPLTPETVSCLPQPKTPWNPEGLSACKHYLRQRVHNPQAPDEPFVQRFCTCSLFRGINGACMSLDDAGIFECEARDPKDARATQVLDAIDARKVKLGLRRIKVEKDEGKVHGYRLFRTPEDLAAGRVVLDEDDITTGEIVRPRLDPMAADDPEPEGNPSASGG